MATIQEVKDALAEERTYALEISEKSLQAIDTITNVGNLYLAIIGIAIAVAALAGLAAVYVGSKREAKRIADERINAYISSEEGSALIQKIVAAEVDSKIAERVSVVVRPPAPAADEENGFPERAPPKRPQKREEADE